MLSWDDFSDQVADLYKNLYDLVFLRTHPLADVLLEDASVPGRDRGWRLHNLLLDTVEALDPGDEAPAFSPPRRRYHLMQSRFVDGLSPDDVARELAISRRQFFREQNEALEKAAEVLWRRYTEAKQPPDSEIQERVAVQSSAARLELLRREAARVKRTNRYARVDEVTEGAASVMREVLAQRQLVLVRSFPASLPVVSVDPSILRQLLLSTLGYLVDLARGGEIHLSATAESPLITLSVALDPPVDLGSHRGGADVGARTAKATISNDESYTETEEHLAALQEMAELSQAQLSQHLDEQGRLSSFKIRLPVAQRTVLIVDDNRDVLELFRRYLESTHHRVVTTDDPQEALDLARRLHPDVMVLDLMMPEQDGWDILQTLLHSPETRHIPVIVCSVLKQKSLALSLGATAFLEKPVSQEQLVSLIQSLA